MLHYIFHDATMRENNKNAKIKFTRPQNQILAYPNSLAPALTLSALSSSSANCCFTFHVRLCTQVNQICPFILAFNYTFSFCVMVEIQIVNHTSSGVFSLVPIIITFQVEISMVGSMFYFVSLYIKLLIHRSMLPVQWFIA